MRRDLLILANVNETQRSSTALNGATGRQRGKGAPDGAGESGNSISQCVFRPPKHLPNCSLISSEIAKKPRRHSDCSETPTGFFVCYCTAN